MKEVLLYAHGSSCNHGSEAIIFTTVKMLRNCSKDAHIVLSTLDYPHDCSALTEVDDYIRNQNTPRNLFFDLVAYANAKLFPRHSFSNWYRYRAFRREIGKYDRGMLCISTGGDNYCTAHPAWLYAQNRLIDQYGYRRILWGASIEPETLGDEMMQDLQGYEAIFVRESITERCLKEKGYRGKLIYHPDPAFTLPTDTSAVPDEMRSGKWIGINLSPVIMNSETQKGAAVQNYRQLVDYILHETDANVALIPHVCIEGNSDYLAMEALFHEYSHTKRVIRISDQFSASQYKGIIAACTMFIGARTHATIAAYSSCVPTLVVGYSVKAKGIAMDLFGHWEDYVLPVQSLRESHELVNAFVKAYARLDEDKRHLCQYIPTFVENATNAEKELKVLLND